MTPYYDQDGITIINADCRDVLTDLPKADAVITDPPYPREFDHVWDILGNDVPFAMADNSFLVTLLGHYQLPRVIDALGRKLSYFWCAVTENNNCPIMHGFKVKVNWKPVLVYRKGKAVPTRIWRDRFNVAAQVALLKDAKSAHKWGQSESLLREPVAAFCPKNGLILDPFVGGGTTLLVARAMERRAIGIEIEERYCEIAANRLRQSVFQFDEPSSASVEQPMFSALEAHPL